VINVGDFRDQVASLQREWDADRRWTGIWREHSAENVIRLRGTVAADHALARHGARRLRELLGSGDAVRALGAAAGDQPAPLVRSGPQAIYLPGPPAPQLVRRINDAMLRADRVAPVVAAADAGPGAAPDAFGLMTAMIEAGAAGVNFDDRLPSRDKRGHLGAKVLVPTGQHIRTLAAARLAADVLDVPSLVIARTGAHEASLLTSADDERDHEFLTGERTADGLHLVQPGRYARVTRALAFAPYADLLWLETSAPNLAEARAFADIIYSQYPDQVLAYSCSPAFDWARLDDASAAKFHRELAAMGYRFQFAAPSCARLQGTVNPDAETAARAGSHEKAQSAVPVG
jgi:isocitrate lyase